jgi:WD40 repeat protein
MGKNDKTLKRLKKLKANLYSYTPLIGKWQRHKAVKALARNGSAEALRMLTEVVTRSADESFIGIVLDTMERLAAQDNPEAQDALCWLVIEHDHSRARQIVVAEQYAPRDPHQRALLFFLTEQWEYYEHFDFDQNLLKTIYPLAASNLRKRLTECARRTGRMEWVTIVAGDRHGKQLGTMTDKEWEVTLSVLRERQSWQEMWRLAQVAPAIWSARLLCRLKDAAWKPKHKAEQVAFKELTKKAEYCQRENTHTLPELMDCSMELVGHPCGVSCLAVSPDSRLLASSGSGWDCTVRLWSLPDGAALHTLEGHTDGVSCLAISPDSRLLVSSGSSWDRTVRLWSLPDGKALQTLERSARLSCLAVSPDGRLLIGSGRHRTVQLWSLPNGTALHTLEGHTWWINCLAVSPDGRLLASGSGDHTVRLWSLPDGEALQTLEGHTGTIICLAVSPDGRLLASGSGDHTVRLWSLPDGEALQKLEGHTGWVNCLAISPDGRLLVSSSGDGTVRLWSLPDGKALQTLGESAECLAIRSDGRLLASGSNDKTVQLWSLPDGAALQTLKGSTVKGPRFVVQRSNGPWESGRHWLKVPTVKGSRFVISPDGQVLANGGEDEVIELWNLWRVQVHRVTHLPVNQTNQKDIRWVQETLQTEKVTQAEQTWLEFLLELMHWYRRHDIELGEAPTSIPAGEFDIEIEA